jgi:hypothetical protein
VQCALTGYRSPIGDRRLISSRMILDVWAGSAKRGVNGHRFDRDQHASFDDAPIAIDGSTSLFRERLSGSATPFQEHILFTGQNDGEKRGATMLRDGI